MELLFSKYSGCGNDFILIDNRKMIFAWQDSALIAQLCQRPAGVGADGVILLERSQKADYRMRIFNADGFEAEMCGNGLRCLKKFLKELGEEASQVSVETKERILQVEDCGSLVRATMGDPENVNLDLKIEVDSKNYTLHALNTGVPHAIYFTNELENVPVSVLGPKIRFHPFFSPQGANANFVELVDTHTISVRTYERGVEAETLACGTGATAAAITAGLCYKLKPPIRVKTRSREELLIDFSIDETGKVHSVSQTGPAQHHFRGFVSL